MKKIILAALAATAITAQAAEVKGTASQKRDLKLGVESVQRAAKEDNPFLACIHYRAALIHLSSVEHQMIDTVNKVRSMEQKVCKLAGV